MKKLLLAYLSLLITTSVNAQKKQVASKNNDTTFTTYKVLNNSFGYKILIGKKTILFNHLSPVEVA